MAGLLNPYAFATGGGAPGLVTFAPHRYWRIQMLEDLGSSYQIAEVELHDTYGGADLCTGGTASASNEVNGAASNAVDNSGATHWRTNSVVLPQWWQYDFGVGITKAICEVSLQGGAASASIRSPARIEVQYSDDGSAWTNAWQARARVWTNGEVKVFKRPTVSLRINVSSNDGAGAGSAHQVAELEFLVATVDQATGGTANVHGIGDVEAALAFDDSNATVWSNVSMAAPYWLRYDFTQNPPFVLEQVSIVVGASSLTRAPKDFTIEQSDDGGYTWNVLKTVTGQTAWGVNEKRTFTI